jgi:hypothetical protein
MAFVNKFHGTTCSRCGEIIAIGHLMNWNRKRGDDSRRWHDPSCPNSVPNQNHNNEGETDGMTTTTTAPANGGAFLAGFADALLPFIEERISTKVDANEVARLIEEKLQGAIFTTVTAVEIKKWDGARVNMGVQHKSFPDLMIAATARDKDGYALNVWLVGPAGTGKSTAPQKLALALDVPFYVQGAIASAHEMLGYMDGGGTYHTTPFRQAWEHGGVFLKDEIDGDFANAQLAFNGALANGLCAFPDSPVPIPRHKDCYLIGAANTWGLSATIDYCGRNKMDAAFLDRFVQLKWPIDESLELATSTNREWTLKVQQWRANVKAKGIKGVMITPRATYQGAALIANGATFDQAAEWAVRGAMSDSDWESIQ